jgi:hypothetical protein
MPNTTRDIGDDGQIFDTITGNELCTSCADEFGEGFLESEPYARSRTGKGICYDCTRDRWSCCYDCDTWVLDDNYNGDAEVCNACVRSNYFECNGCGCMYSNDYNGGNNVCESCEREYGDNEDGHRHVHGYHRGAPFDQTFHTATGKLTWGTQRRLGDLTYYGVEFECENVGEYFPDMLTDLEHGKFAHAESDSSLTNGFETITQPATAFAWLHGDMGRVMRQFHTNMMNDGATFEGGNIGGHVHVSRTAFAGKDPAGHLARFALFGTFNRQYMRQLSGRKYDSTYAHLDPYAPTRIQRAVKWQNDDRSRWCNLTNSDTIEVRLFSGSDLFDDYLGAIDWVRALTDFTRTLTAGDCLAGAIASQSFHQWLADSHHTQALRLVLSRVKVSHLQ